MSAKAISAASRKATRQHSPSTRFPKRIFHGAVTQVRQSPQTVQNVVTYDVVVSVDNSDLALKPGMTAATRIIIDQRDDVLRVPDQALRYRRRADRSGGESPACRDAAHAQIWVLRDGQPVAVPVVTGLDDDSFTEIVSGDLKPGDQVITGEQSAAHAAASRACRAPRSEQPDGSRTDMPEPVIRVENVTRTYHVGDVDVHALRGVSLTSSAASSSPSWARPAPANRRSCRSSAASTGRPAAIICFEGVDVARLSEPELARIRSERLGFVFQSFNLLARTSAHRERRACRCSMRRPGPRGVASRFERARAALQPARPRRSRAQHARPALRRPAATRRHRARPDQRAGLLLADEPTGNLDTRTSHEIMETLHALNRERGVTIIVVTHESDIAAYADRIVTMRDGQIISDQRTSTAAPRARR